MSKVFNTTAVCIPEEHYMVNIAQRLQEIKALVDDGKYFTINKARSVWKDYDIDRIKAIAGIRILCCTDGFSDIRQC